MYKLVSLLALMATASTFCGASIAAETLFASALFPASTIDPLGADGAVVLAGGMGGGGMSGGGMGGGGMTRGGMGGGMTGGSMTGGGMGGGMTAGGMTGAPAGNFGGTSDAAQTGNSTPSAYYTYQCVTPTTQCSFAAPASLRSTSLSAGARCSCLEGRSDGHIK
jgi:hypothetical protein